MENSERFVEMSGDEVSKLRKYLFYTVFYTLAANIIALLICALLYLYIGNYFCSVILLIAAIGITLGYLVKVVRIVKTVLADTGGRKKKIFVGKIERRDEKVTETKQGRGFTRALLGVRMTTSTSIDSEYFVKLVNDNSAYPVPMELFYAVKEGDLVEISIAPNSGYIFGVTKFGY